MDRETFAASVQSRQDALFRVAFSILQNREDALVQPLDVEIEFALLRAVSEGDAPDLEAFATLSKNITVAVTLATLDLAPDKPIFLSDCEAAFTRFALSPLSTRLDFALIPHINTQEAAQKLAETYGGYRAVRCGRSARLLSGYGLALLRQPAGRMPGRAMAMRIQRRSAGACGYAGCALSSCGGRQRRCKGF